MAELRTCCFVKYTELRQFGEGCGLEAEWEITWSEDGKAPHDCFTDACAAHVGDLLNPGLNVITRIEEWHANAAAELALPSIVEKAKYLEVEKDMVLDALQEAVQVAGHDVLIGHYTYLTGVLDSGIRKRLVDEKIRSGQ